MSRDSLSIEIKNMGSTMNPKYRYITGTESAPMASSLMYQRFAINFDDSSRATSFFSDKKGIELLKTMLSAKKCPLFDASEAEKDQNYIANLNRCFDIIIGFFSSLSNAGKTKMTYSTYLSITSQIKDKANETDIKNSIVGKRLMEIITVFNPKSERLKVSSIASSIQLNGSIDQAKHNILITSIINNITKMSLSPVDPSVFDIIRQFCIDYVGEGKKVSDESGHNIEALRNSLLMALGLFRHRLTYELVKSDKKSKNEKLYRVEGNTNQNKMENINNLLIALLMNPNKTKVLIKLMKKMLKFKPELENDIKILDTIFISDNFKSEMIFEYTPSTSYICGTDSKPIPIIRKLLEERKVEKKKKPKNFMYSSDSDDETPRVVSPYPDHISISIDDDVVIPLATTKNILKLLNEGLNPTANFENKKKAEETLKAIENDTFGDITADLVLDWWQNLFIEKTKNSESFVLVGDTSGGKTFVSLMAMRILFNQYVNETSARFIYLAPTPQLAILQFANILTAYPDYSEFFGICCKLIVNVPNKARILIGTPNEVKKYLSEIKYGYKVELTPENIGASMKDAIDNPTFDTCRTLFIDEIQTWSQTYVQDIEKEQVMECKAIEEIIKLVNFNNDSKSQVIGMSATLSPISVENIKNKISLLTSIPTVTDIIYTHGDIGLVNKEDKNKPGYVPLMQKPIIKAVKFETGDITSFKDEEEIYQQNLDSRAIEIIIRDAESSGVLPIAFFRESELSTIQMFKDYIDYMEQKNKSCVIWHRLYKDYSHDIDNSGFIGMTQQAQIDKWIAKLRKEILDIIRDINSEKATNIERFKPFEKIISEFVPKSSVNYSPELYGLLYEYRAFTNGAMPFNGEIHPYYRFGTVSNANNFFTLEDNVKKTETNLKKILMAQDADPSNNTGSIIPLIMRGIQYGCGILTSSVPLGIQLELYKFINIKSKSETNPIPILFCEYGMSMGMNTSIMSVCICRYSLSEIGPSEFKQIGGRPGRRGNSNGKSPVIYTFNLLNSYKINLFENLDFSCDTISSTFFTSDEVYEYLAKIVAKFENNKVTILDKIQTQIENIISGDTFKNLGSSDILIVRKIQIAKAQISEMFNYIRNTNPSIATSIIVPFYSYLQRAELYSLNVQIR